MSTSNQLFMNSSIVLLSNSTILIYLSSLGCFFVILNVCDYSNDYKTNNVQGTIVQFALYFLQLVCYIATLYTKFL